MFIVFALTDWLDGWLARRLNQVSSFGAFLDPVADKFLVCASLLILVWLHRVDTLVALVIIGREIAISALREWMAQIGASRSVAVHMIGKVKTVTQMVAIPFLLYDGKLFRLIDTRIWGTVLIYIAAVLTIWSMVYYLRKALPEIRARARMSASMPGSERARTHLAARDAGRVRFDLEHRLRRRAFGHAACPADGLFVLALRAVDRRHRRLDRAVARRRVATRAAPMVSSGRAGHAAAWRLSRWRVGGREGGHAGRAWPR